MPCSHDRTLRSCVDRSRCTHRRRSGWAAHSPPLARLHHRRRHRNRPHRSRPPCRRGRPLGPPCPRTHRGLHRLARRPPHRPSPARRSPRPTRRRRCHPLRPRTTSSPRSLLNRLRRTGATRPPKPQRRTLQEHQKTLAWKPRSQSEGSGLRSAPETIRGASAQTAGRPLAPGPPAKSTRTMSISIRDAQSHAGGAGPLPRRPTQSTRPSTVAAPRRRSPPRYAPGATASARASTLGAPRAARSWDRSSVVRQPSLTRSVSQNYSASLSSEFCITYLLTDSGASSMLLPEKIGP